MSDGQNESPDDILFLALAAEMVTKLKEEALNLGVGDRLITIMMVGLKDEEESKIVSVYDLHATDDDHLIEGLDFLDQAINERLEDRPEPGTFEWWVNKMK